MLRVMAPAEAEADADGLGQTEIKGGADALDQVLGDGDDIVAPDVFKDDQEFVAAKPGDGVGFAHVLAQPIGDDLEQLIADRMAERVVDRLEAVKV